MNPTIDVKKLAEIKRQLQRGDMVRIARRLNLAPVTVYKCFNGELNNLRIIEQALNLIDENQLILAKIDKNYFKNAIKSQSSKA